MQHDIANYPESIGTSSTPASPSEGQGSCLGTCYAGRQTAERNAVWRELWAALRHAPAELQHATQLYHAPGKVEGRWHVGDREPEATGPLKYAPKWARMAEPAAPAIAGGRGGANARPPEHQPAAERGHSPERSPPERKPPPARSRPQESAPPWKLIGRPGAFEGDVAIKELRERMALAPDRPPEPPIRNKGAAVFGMVDRRARLVALAAVAAFGFVPGNQLEGQ
jgi:hypothetical protein